MLHRRGLKPPATRLPRHTSVTPTDRAPRGAKATAHGQPLCPVPSRRASFGPRRFKNLLRPTAVLPGQSSSSFACRRVGGGAAAVRRSPPHSRGAGERRGRGGAPTHRALQRASKVSGFLCIHVDSRLRRWAWRSRWGQAAPAGQGRGAPSGPVAAVEGRAPAAEGTPESLAGLQHLPTQVPR